MMKQLFLITFTLTIHNTYAQLIPVSFDQRVKTATTIVLAHPVEQQSYWDADHANIWTRTVFKVNAYVKGANSELFVATISAGGVVDNQAQVTCPTEHFEANTDYALFLAADNPKIDDKDYRLAHPNIRQSEVYATLQGVLTYDGRHYHDALVEAPMTETALLSRLQFGYGLTAVTPENKLYSVRNPMPVLTPTATITSITDGSGSLPASGFVAGTIAAANELIINGSGFGTTVGTVQFTNSDDPATLVSSIASDIVSWTDTKIRLKIHEKAATGTFNVLVGSTTIASSSMNVKWGELNVTSTSFGFSTSTRQQVHLSNRNTLGGYTFQYSSNTTAGGLAFSADVAAKAAFARAVSTWRCNTLVNYGLGATTAVGYAADAVSVVLYDNTSLPAGALAVCTSRYGGSSNASCTLYSAVWYLTEMDIRVLPIPATGATWNFTTGAPGALQWDFESVILHEIGHGHGLTHINNSARLMNWSIANAVTRRTPHIDEIEAGNYRIAQSTGANCITTVLPITPISIGSCTVIPIEWLSFSGEKVKNRVNLTWSTASEHNNKGFDVERSADGKTFETVGFVKGQGSSAATQHYDFADTPPQYNGDIVYYRLKQTDTDGAFSYSKTLSFIRDAAADWFVFPNPSKSDIFIKSNKNTRTPVSIELTDLLGRTLKQRFVDDFNGADGIHQSLEDLPNGLYFLKITSNNSILLTQRIVKSGE